MCLNNAVLMLCLQRKGNNMLEPLSTVLRHYPAFVKRALKSNIQSGFRDNSMALKRRHVAKHTFITQINAFN